jgi:hypothetical protein
MLSIGTILLIEGFVAEGFQPARPPCQESQPVGSLVTA